MKDEVPAQGKHDSEEHTEDTGIIKTWKWKLPDGIFPIPEHIDPGIYRCTNCEWGYVYQVLRKRTHSECFVPYEYQEKTFYVCCSCGNVYENSYDPEKGRADFRIWEDLYRQPYYWNKIPDKPGFMAYDFIHNNGNIPNHPFLDAHCKNDVRDAAETVVRFLIYLGREVFQAALFMTDTARCRIVRRPDELTVSSGKEDGSFPNDGFSVYREGKNSFSLEMSQVHRENIFGYTCDVNEEDYEYFADYLYCKLSFISNHERDLPENVKMLDRVPMRQERWESRVSRMKGILKDPFGLEGFFLFEKQLNYHYFGVGETANPYYADGNEEDDL